MKTTFHLSLSAFVAVSLFLGGCQQNQGGGGESSDENTTATASAGSSGDTIALGVAAPFTGDNAEFGIQIKMGVELGQQQINDAGGLNGKQVELKEMDDAGNPAEAQNVATTLANDDSVVAVIGHFNSSCSLAGKDSYTQAKMVMFSPGSTNVKVTKDSDYVFRNIFSDDFQGQSLANYVGNVLKLKNVAILFDNDDYGSGLKESFKKRAAELGLNIVSETAYGKDTNDFRSQLETIRSSKPDIILVAGLYKSAAVIAKQARELGINTQLIGGDGVNSQQFIDLAGGAAEGTYVTCPFLFDLGGERAQKFAEAFHKKYNREPDAWSALSYDAIQILAAAIKAKGATREGILEYLKGVNSPENAFDGLTGTTYFDAEGDCKKPVQVALVKGGKFVAAPMQLGKDGQPIPASALAGKSGAAEANTNSTEANAAASTSSAATMEAPTSAPMSTSPSSAVSTGTQTAAPPQG